jgi:tetratricopeptide (TPR) repeat protein
VTESTTFPHPAELYLRFLGGDEQVRRALLACSAALQWDDEAARAAVALVAESNGSTARLVEEIKGLACVWRRWDGSWYLADEVRTYLHDRLEAEIDAPTRKRLYEVLAAHGDRRLGEISPDGPLAVFRRRGRMIESAYPRLLDPDRAEEGGRLLGTVWSEARGPARAATCQAVAHLVPELSRRVRRLPDEVLFLRGMAAYQRGTRKTAEADFKVVYENGRPGEIHAVAAHLYGRLVRDKSVAEQALHDGIRWYTERHHQGQVWHSLGNLLSKDRRRWGEAEEGYRKSLELDPTPEHQGQVWHSLGNLLSKDRRRWGEAEEAYRKSLELDPTPEHQGQVLASLAGALMKRGDPGVYDQAEEYALEAQRRDPRGLKMRGVTNRILAKLYEARGEWEKAIAALGVLQETNRRLGIREHEERIQQRIDELRLRSRSSA